MRSAVPAYRRYLQTTAAFIVVAALPSLAHAGPEGGVVVGGTAQITQSGATTTINQSSDRALIRWDSFDVGATEHVRFNQPSAGSITVNRITDSKASRIDGRLSANGNVVLINPNGMVFGASAVVDVGGLVATSSDLEDDNAFLSGGAVKFTRPGQHDAQILNHGSMTVREAGLAGLVAPHVENNGVIQAHMGRVHLASGDIHTVDFAGDGLIRLEVSDAVLAQSVHNSGTIIADGGQVFMGAAAARAIVDSLIDNSGTVRAMTVASHKGTIKLTTRGLADTPEKSGGRVVNTGRILAEGVADDTDGGVVTILADAIAMTGEAVVSVAAARDAGDMRIGGDYQGAGGLPNSDDIFIDRHVVLNAGSRRNGRGGRIIVWSDENTRFLGHADVAGMTGGFVEVSGKEWLDFGGTVNLAGTSGADGTLLLDPTNITISGAADQNVSGSSPYAPTADGVTSVLNANTLMAALASGNVIVQTRATGAQAGIITVDSALTWASGKTLTLDAHAGITVNQKISGGSLHMIAGGAVTLNETIAGTGTLTIEQRGDAVTMGVGAGTAGTVKIEALSLSRITDGWQDIILGRATGTATVQVGATTWADNLTIRSGTGTITLNGNVNVGANNLTIITNGDINATATTSASGTGVLRLVQATADATIGTGGQAGALNVNATEVTRLTNNNWSQIIIGRADGTGAVNLGTATWRGNVTVQSGTGVISILGVQRVDANDLTFITDADIVVAATANILYGSKTLTFATQSAGTSIGLGDGQAGTLNLSTAEISRIRDGWSNIVIGRTDGTADINMGTLTWVDPLTLQAGSGNILVNGMPTMSGNKLTLSTQGGKIAMAAGLSQTTGALSIDSMGGDIKATGALNGTTGGVWALNSGGGDIDIEDLVKSSGSVTISADGGDINIAKAMSVGTAATSITTDATGKINIGDTLTLSSAALTIATNGGSIHTKSIGGTNTGAWQFSSHGGAINIDGGLTRTGGNVGIDAGSGALVITGNSSFASGAVTINAASVHAGILAFSTGALNVATGGGDFYTKGINGLLTGIWSVSTNGGAITIDGELQKTGGSVIFDTGGGAITIEESTSLGAASATFITDGGNILTDSISQGSAALTIESGGGDVYIGGTITRTGGMMTIDSGAGALTLLSAAAMGAGSATLITDSNINIGGNLSGTGALAIRQASAGTSFAIGNGQVGDVHISDAEHARLVDGWSSITLGRADSSGALNVRSGLSWDDALILQTGSGALNINGAMAMGANNLTLRTDSDLSVKGAVTGTTTLSLVQASESTSIGVGEGQAGTYNVNAEELDFLLGGWATLIIGRTDSTGDLNLVGRTWTNALNLRSGTGTLSVNGDTAVGGRNITITTDSNLNIAGKMTGSETLTIQQSSSSTTIGLGTGQVGNLQLTDEELNNLGTSWKSVVIGSTTGDAVINVGGRTWSDPLTLRSGTGTININGAVAMGGNSLTINNNGGLDIHDGASLKGTGTLTIAPTIASTSIGIGDGQAGDLVLSNDELSRILDGFSSIIIGSTSLTGAMNVSAGTWTDPLTLRTGSGQMNINGNIDMLGNNLTLSTNSDLYIGGSLSGTGALTIQPSSSSVSMGIGTGQAGTINISTDELDLIQPGWTNVIFGTTSITAAMNIIGRTWGHSVEFRTNTGAMNINGVQNLGENNLTIRTNTNLAINHILAGSGNLAIMNSGTAAANTMGIGTGQAGQLHLSNDEIDLFRNAGWTNILFGNTGSQGALNVGAQTWDSNVTFRHAGNTTNNLNINGVQTVQNGKNLTLTSNNDIAIGHALNGTGTLTIAQSSALTGMGVGDGQAGTVKISNAELGLIGAGWGQLVFGTTLTASSGTYLALNVGAYNWNHNVTIRSAGNPININGAQNMGARNLTIQSNVNPNINNDLIGTGILTFTTTAPNVTIGVAGSGTMNLSEGELVRIGSGWQDVVIGRVDGTGAVGVGSRNWNHNLTLQSGSGVITLAGANMGAHNLTVATNANLAITGDLQGTGNLTIRNASGLTNLAVGTGQAGTVLIDSTELSRILAGWNLVTFGGTQSFGNINIGANAWSNPMRFVTQGNVVVNGAQSSTLMGGTSLVFATTGGSFINNAGPDAIDPGGGRYLVYSVAETSDTLGGLIRPTILTDLSYSGYGPESVVEAGDVYIYAGFAAKILFISIDDVEKIYGSANPLFTYSYIGGLQNGDLLEDIILSYNLFAPGSNVLDDAGTTRLINGTFNLGGDYGINLITGTLTVTKATLTVTADSDSREYGIANPSLSVSYSGFVNGDDESVLNSLSIASTAANILSNVGSYTISAAGGSADNYDFEYVNGVLDITKATLNATVQNATREYGEDNPGFSIVYSGFRNGDTIAVIDTLATADTVADVTANVGTYAITASGGIDNNYKFNYISGSLSVTQATLTATADNLSRSYGADNPPLTITYTGFRNGDTIAVIDTLALAETVATSTSGVGQYTISASGAADNNYKFIYADGILDIGKATVTVTANNESRIYGDNNPVFSISYSGFMNAEDESVLTAAATAASIADVLSSVGSYAITASGAAADNYDFQYVAGTLTIARATLDVTVQNESRVYGDANPSFTLDYTGFRNGDGIADIHTPATASTSAVAESDVGLYAITAAGAAADNYNFNYIDGTLMITKAMLTATANNASRAYGDDNPALSVSYSGFRNGDTIAVLDTLATATTTANAHANVGQYQIAASGGVDNNYDFSYVDGVLDITKAIVTVTANSYNRTYGDVNPALDIGYSGFRNGQNQSILLTAATASTLADAASGVGAYTITAAGASADNYDFVYVDGVMNVTKAILTVSVDNASRIYGDPNPAFNINYAGFRNGDTIAALSSTATASGPGPAAGVGTHAITASGAAAANYTFDYVDGALTITPALLTAAVNNATRASNEPNPVFTVTYTGFRNGETASVLAAPPIASTNAGPNAAAGNYAITLAGGVAANYSFSYIDGVLTVTAPVNTVSTNPGMGVIPVTVEESLTTRYIYMPTNLRPGSVLSSEESRRPRIVVIPDASGYMMNDADNDFLIAITSSLQSAEEDQPR